MGLPAVLPFASSAEIFQEKVQPNNTQASGGSTLKPREWHLKWVEKLASPVLAAQADKEIGLQKVLPKTLNPNRFQFAPLEAFARTLVGLAPWFNLPPEMLPPAERKLQQKLFKQAVEGLALGLDPDSTTAFYFGTEGRQALVDTAFLSQALLNAPRLLSALPPIAQDHLKARLLETRNIQPYPNNWVFFAAMVEALLNKLGVTVMPERLDQALNQMEAWYAGDGVYKDGSTYHADYYNSFVIYPMMADILRHLPTGHPLRESYQEKVQLRLARYAQQLERSLSPEGYFPAIGRSIVYRCGAFQALSYWAWQHLGLSANINISYGEGQVLPAGTVRKALQLVIDKTLSPTQTFDSKGWLNPGLYGHQPALAEFYINTGSLYLCTTAFLHLGIRPEHPYWSAGLKGSLSSEWLMAGRDLKADKAISN